MPVTGGGTGHIMTTRTGQPSLSCGASLSQDINKSVNVPVDHRHISYPDAENLHHIGKLVLWSGLCDEVTFRLRSEDQGLSWWLSGREPSCECRRCGFDLRVRKITRRRKQQPTPVFLSGKSHGQRSLTRYSP